MNKIMTTAILALMTSSVFSQNGWDKHGHGYGQGTCSTPAPVYVNTYRAPQPQRGAYIMPKPVRYAVPVQQCGPLAMDPGSFCQLRETIHRASFESTKLSIFRQAMAYNYFTSQQVLQLMNEFCFESYRLDVAKMAYCKTVDPGNYYVVNNAFSFSSSVNELGEYLAMR